MLRQRAGSADDISEREEEVTKEMKIILTFFLVQKINWPHVQEGFYLGHRVLPMGIAILTNQARQEFSSNNVQDSFLSSTCRNSLRSTKPMGVVVGEMCRNWG